jgi:RNAse (barnase) inhibitor barstar
VKCFLKVGYPVLVFVSRNVLHDVAFKKTHVLRDDEVPGLDALFDVMVSTHLIVVG